VVTDEEEAEELVLDPDVFDRPPHLDGDHGHDGHGRDHGRHGDEHPPRDH
jgi:membrane-associated protein